MAKIDSGPFWSVCENSIPSAEIFDGRTVPIARQFFAWHAGYQYRRVDASHQKAVRKLEPRKDNDDKK